MAKKTKKTKELKGVENVSQTLTVPISYFLSEIPEKNRVALTSYLSLVHQKENPKEGDEPVSDDVLSSLQAAQLEDLPPESLRLIKELGGEYPSDMIDISLTLGGILFDLWISTLDKPSAPIRIAMYNKKNQEYAALLSEQGDDFVIPADVIEAAEKVASSDEEWEKAQVMLTLEKGSIPVNNKGAEMFGDIMTKLVEIAT